MLCSICVVHLQLGKHVLGYADHTAPIWQHHLYLPDETRTKEPAVCPESHRSTIGM